MPCGVRSSFPAGWLLLEGPIGSGSLQGAQPQHPLPQAAAATSLCLILLFFDISSSDQAAIPLTL